MLGTMESSNRNHRVSAHGFPTDTVYDGTVTDIQLSRCLYNELEASYRYQLEEWQHGCQKATMTDDFLDLQQIAWVPIESSARPRRSLISELALAELIKDFGLGPAYQSCGTFIRGYTALCPTRTNLQTYCIKFGDFCSLLWSYDVGRCKTRAIFWGTNEQISAVQKIVECERGPAYHNAMFVGLATVMIIDSYLRDELDNMWADLGAIEGKTGHTSWANKHIKAADDDWRTVSEKTTGIKTRLAARECFKYTAATITNFLQQSLRTPGAPTESAAWAAQAEAGISHMEHLSKMALLRLEEHHNTIVYYIKRADSQLTAVS
jgi:hypothetical protein